MPADRDPRTQADPDLLKAREWAEKALDNMNDLYPYIATRKAITAALLRARADGMRECTFIGFPHNELLEKAAQLRALADREEGSNN